MRGDFIFSESPSCVKALPGAAHKSDIFVVSGWRQKLCLRPMTGRETEAVNVASIVHMMSKI